MFKRKRSEGVNYTMENVPVNSDLTPRGRRPNVTLPFILFALFVALSIAVVYHMVDPFDIAVVELIRHYASLSITKMFIMVTQFCSLIVLVPLVFAIMGYLFIRLKQKVQPLLLAASLSGELLLEVILKQIFLRPRPSITHWVVATGYSFPSGHSMRSAAFYGMLGYLLYIELKHRNKRAWYIPITTIVVIIAIGFSRIYLGVHYPTDVIGGYLIGGCWAVTVFNSMKLYIKTRKCKQSSNSFSL